MKNKTKILFLCIMIVLLLIIGISIFSYATTNSNSSLILTKEKLSNPQNSFIKISDYSKYDVKLLLNKVCEYKSQISSDNKEDINSLLENNDYKFEFIINELDSRTECIIEFNNDVFYLNADTGDLLTYSEKCSNLIPSKLNEEEIKSIGIEIYENIKEILNEDYSYQGLQQYTDEIWTVEFNKVYDNLSNPGEAVKISFSPENKEIVNLTILRVPYANNSIEISKEEAFNIAEKYMKKTTATKMDVEIQIVRPNYFWDKDNGNYKKVSTLRHAYVFTCNNDANVKIYVDCTTGEVIGGDMIVGGEI